MDNSTHLSVGQSLKRRLRAMIPSAIQEPMLSLWRKYYWKIRTRIPHKRNLKVAREIVENARARARPIKLELGSSRRPGRDDWVFSDIGGSGDIQLDFTDPLPFPDNSVDNIYSSHILEHFSYPHPMLDFLKECHRVLKKEGSFSIAVPNAKIFLDAYANPGAFDKDKYCSWDVGLKYRSSIDFVNFIAYMGGDHKHLFDAINLVTVLQEVGFRDVRVRDFDPDLDLEVRRHESIYAAAVK